LISIDARATTWFLVILISVNIITIGFAVHSIYGQASFSGGQPIINDPSLKADLVFQGLRNPTSMAFLGPNDILVLEKDQGTVQRIVNGNMLPQPVLHVNVASEGERGMLGIAIAKPTTATTARFVFLYYTQSKSAIPLGNYVYRYELVDNKLINPKLILKLPASPGPIHDGGKVLIGPDKNVYAVIGDLRNHRTQAQNIASGGQPDLTSGIIRVTKDGKSPLDDPL
jgi:aldose sugar dehydrogenase